MKTDKVLGAIVAGCLMVIALAIVFTQYKKDEAVVQINKVVYAPMNIKPLSQKVAEVAQTDLDCMTLNLYFEARNQDTEAAMAAVGYTVLNRVESKNYPDSICDVVFQGRRDASGNYVRNKCQFSWVCDGKADKPNMNHPVEASAWKKANKVAVKVLTGKIRNPVGNATMYHATYVNPRWAKSFAIVAQIEDHIFYEKAKKRS